ncbi:uncharacterized protein METZ01_LOCUS324694, partial [marine metagenome]
MQKQVPPRASVLLAITAIGILAMFVAARAQLSQTSPY